VETFANSDQETRVWSNSQKIQPIPCPFYLLEDAEIFLGSFSSQKKAKTLAKIASLTKSPVYNAKCLCYSLIESHMQDFGAPLAAGKFIFVERLTSCTVKDLKNLPFESEQVDLLIDFIVQLKNKILSHRAIKLLISSIGYDRVSR
jgi:hypothetical protein